jgi:hypothetical protein
MRGRSMRHVNGDEHRAQFVVRQHHRELGRAGPVRQDLRVSGIGDARGLQRLLGDRRCDDCADFAGHGEVDRLHHIVVRRPPRPRIDLADRQIARQDADAEHGELAGRTGHIGHIRDLANDNVETERLGRAPEQAGIADHERRRRQPCCKQLDADLRPDPARVTHGDGDRLGHATGLSMPGMFCLIEDALRSRGVQIICMSKWEASHLSGTELGPAQRPALGAMRA